MGHLVLMEYTYNTPGIISSAAFQVSVWLFPTHVSRGEAGIPAVGHMAQSCPKLSARPVGMFVSKKLAPRYIRTYKIIKSIKLLVYYLVLPHTISINSTFHVSWLNSAFCSPMRAHHRRNLGLYLETCVRLTQCLWPWSVGTAWS